MRAFRGHRYSFSVTFSNLSRPIAAWVEIIMSEKLGLVGRKIGMTRIFTEDGVSIPVTVLEVSNNRITQVKTVETDGYNAVQVAFGSKKPSRVSKPLKGQFEKAGVEAGSMLKEFHVEEDKIGEMKVGQTLSIDMFSEGQKVDVDRKSVV